MRAEYKLPRLSKPRFTRHVARGLRMLIDSVDNEQMMRLRDARAGGLKHVDLEDMERAHEWMKGMLNWYVANQGKNHD